MSLREKNSGIQSKYVQSPNGRIFLNTPNLAKLSGMSAIDIQGFKDPVPETVDQLNTMIADAIKKANGNISETARLLNIPRSTLVYRLKKYNIV